MVRVGCSLARGERTGVRLRQLPAGSMLSAQGLLSGAALARFGGRIRGIPQAQGADPERTRKPYRQFPPGFFDLIDIDACHQASPRI